MRIFYIRGLLNKEKIDLVQKWGKVTDFALLSKL